MFSSNAGHHLQVRPANFEDRYRLYIDESGDHVFRATGELSHRYLCLLGCWFLNPDYLHFHNELERLKQRFLPHHPDDPVVLHRDDIINARRAFKDLRDDSVREAFNFALLDLIRATSFKAVAVVIDKNALSNSFGEASAHPYHLGLGFLLQRYAGFLNHVNRVGDVMAESRGGEEDRLLKDSYTRVYEHGAWEVRHNTFQAALSSCQLKLKTKHANISGLQLADLLGHPVKQWVLKQEGILTENLAPFAEKLMEIVEKKLNCHLYDGRVRGYGYVLYPKK